MREMLFLRLIFMILIFRKYSDKNKIFIISLIVSVFQWAHADIALKIFTKERSIGKV